MTPLKFLLWILVGGIGIIIISIVLFIVIAIFWSVITKITADNLYDDGRGK